MGGISRVLAALLLLTALPPPAHADPSVLSAPVPWGQVGPTQTLSASGTSATVALGWTQVTPAPKPPPQTIVVCNTASGAVDAYALPVPASTSVVTTGTGTLVPAGSCQYIALGAPTNLFLAAITGGSATTLSVMTGIGTLSAGGVGSGGGLGVFMTTTAGNAMLPTARNNLGIYNVNITDTAFSGGAVCDAVHTTSGGSVAASSTAFTGTFPSGMVGTTKTIQIPGAGAGGAAHTTNVSITSTSAGTLAAAATNAASSATSNAFIARARTSGNAVNSYAPADTLTVNGTANTVVTINQTTLLAGTLTGGSGYNVGDVISLTAVAGTQLGQARILVTSLSGSAPNAFQIVEGGVFTGNPTSFTQASLSGTTGTGLTITSPIYGIYVGPRALSITSPGSNTSVPANPVTPSSTSGSGQGATIDIAWHQDGDFAFGTDNQAAIAAAITYAATRGYNVALPVNTPCGLASGVSVTSNFTEFVSQSPPPRFTGQSAVTPNAALMWLGATGGTMVQFSSTAGGGNNPIAGSGIEAISLYGNSIAGRGAQFLSVNSLRANNIYIEEFQIAGIESSIISGSLATEKCSQQGRIDNINSKIYGSAGAGVLLDGNSTCNASYIQGDNWNINYAYGEGVSVLSADHIFIKNLQGFRYPTGWGIGLHVGCGGLGTFAGAGIYLDGMTTSDGGMAVDGLENCGTAAIVTNRNYDKTNGSPIPTTGVQATHVFQRETGDEYGLYTGGGLANGQVYLNGAGNLSSITATTSGSTASGSFTIVTSSAANLFKGMVSNGNTSIPNGSVITGISSNTLTLSLATTGIIGNGTSEKFYSGANLCPENGGGLVVGASLRQLPADCLWQPTISVSGPSLPNSGTWYFYAGNFGTPVIGAASSDATRNLVRVTLTSTAGFHTGDPIRCAGLTGTTEANNSGPNYAIGNLVDGTHIDLQGSTFANAYTGGGYCTWVGLEFNARSYNILTGTGGTGGIPTLTGYAPWSLAGATATNSDSGNTLINQPLNTNTSAGTASWYNRKPKQCLTTVGSDPTATTTSYTELSSSLRCFFWVWNNPGATVTTTTNYSVGWSIGGGVVNDTVLDGCATAIGFDGTTAEAMQSASVGATTKEPVSLSGFKYGLAEGLHSARPLGKTISGGTCTWDHNYLAAQILSYQ